MIWPTIIVDNFFEDPNKIIEYSKKLTFKKDEQGEWPGERANTVQEIDFFNWVIYRIVRILYPMNHREISWNCSQNFQKIDGNIYRDSGWVHSDDPCEITAIIYLSKHKNCGTSLYTKKNFSNSTMHSDKKIESYQTLNFDGKLKYLEENNNLFEKNLTVDSKFNRLLIFDSNQFHGADMFRDNENKEERFTLITFFNHIHCANIKYPITEMKRDL